jgi:hypothetical protein
MSPDMGEKESCSILSCHCLLARNKANHLAESINDYKDIVMASLCPWQAPEKIHGNAFPWPAWYWQRHVKPHLPVGWFRNIA